MVGLGFQTILLSLVCPDDHKKNLQFRTQNAHRLQLYCKMVQKMQIQMTRYLESYISKIYIVYKQTNKKYIIQKFSKLVSLTCG